MDAANLTKVVIDALEDLINEETARVIAMRAPTLFSRLLAGAMALNIFVYAFVNMGMVSGILPVVGVPLPFVSYGGTAMATLGIGLGVLLAISRSDRLIKS